MSNVKKVFQPMFAVLLANQTATVSDIMPELEALAVAKTGGGGSRANTYLMIDGTCVAQFCYYHKAWFNPEEVDFGTKKTAITGINNMTTHGLSLWNKQRSEYNKVRQDALSDFAADVIDGDELKAIMASAEDAKNAVTEHPAGGFASLTALVENYGFDVDMDTVAAIDESRSAALASGEDTAE